MALSKILAQLVDKLGNTWSVRGWQDTDGSVGWGSAIEIGGALVSGSNGLPTIGAGSTGIDHSINAASIPASGFVELVQIAANPARAFIEVQNQSAATIQLVRDTGTGTQQTSLMLAPAAAVGQQGGGWSSATFKGRLTIYGASGAQVAAYED